MTNTVMHGICWSIAAALVVAVALGPGMPVVQAQPLEKVVITQGAHVLSFFPLYVAVHNGYWKEEGLDVEIIFTRGGGECLTAVLSGDAVVCSTATPPMLQAWSQGHTNLISVGSLINRFTEHGVVRRDFLAARGIAEDQFRQMPVLERVRLLRGGTLAITGPGAMTDVFTRWITRQAGLDPDRDVSIVALGGMPAYYPAFLSGRIDAFIAAPPLSQQLVAEGAAVSFISLMEGELDGFSPAVYEVLVTRKQLIEERPDLVQAVVNGLRKANNFIADHVNDMETLSGIARAYFPELDQQVLEMVLSGVAPGVPREGRHTLEAWEAVVTFVESAGLVEPGILDPSEGNFWTSRFTR